MCKASTDTNQNDEGNMPPEYDFAGGTSGKHFRAVQAGYTVTIHQSDGTTVTEVAPKEGAIVLAPDVREYFPDSESVNAALRGLIKLIPEKRPAAADTTEPA